MKLRNESFHESNPSGQYSSGGQTRVSTRFRFSTPALAFRSVGLRLYRNLNLEEIPVPGHERAVVAHDPHRTRRNVFRLLLIEPGHQLRAGFVDRGVVRSPRQPMLTTVIAGTSLTSTLPCLPVDPGRVSRKGTTWSVLCFFACEGRRSPSRPGQSWSHYSALMCWKRVQNSAIPEAVALRYAG